MKKITLRALSCLAGGLLLALPAFGQENVNRQLYPDYSARVKPDARLLSAGRSAERPDHVNNALNIHFPPIINQDGGSCGSASRIAYMFTYEMNALRGTDASLEENQYPTHFTWLLTNSNSGKDAMAIANGVPNVTTYGGRTCSQLFGSQDCSDPDFGWMQGYDKWYAAMFNRLERTANFPLSVETEEGREAVKNWLWNHNGDSDFAAGGVCGIGMASHGVWAQIPQTETNDALGLTGMSYVQSWGTAVDHAQTIVGYDDRVEFDLDGNGIAGEVDKDERGAWIVANSWGNTWGNSGFIYCPYKHAVVTGTSGSYYQPEVYHVRKNYRPLRTMKITMDYSKRSEICLSAGISSDLSATEPERTVQFEHFRYAGDGDGDGVDAEVPMLGRWKDGLHSEPMEFGYDLTDLSAKFDTRKPLKYFFIIESKSTASGKGTVHGCSVIDYEFDTKGIETSFGIGAEGVKVETAGKRTIISVVVSGEPFNAPRNAALADGVLSWEAPAATHYALKGYKVYAADGPMASLGKEQLSCPVEAVANGYRVSAVYDLDGKEVESARVEAAVPAPEAVQSETNYIRSFTNSGFTVKNLFDEKREAVTIEYWLRPTNCINWNQQLGPGWPSGFMAHTTSAGEFVVGWNTSNRITTSAGSLRAGQWTHVAIVVDGNTITAFLNGEKAGEVSSTASGIGGFGDLVVGAVGSAGINGAMDEFRVWNTARTQRQIQNLMYAELGDPANTPGLLVEIKMNAATTDTPVDATGRFTVTRLSGTQSRTIYNKLQEDPRTLTADFALPDAPYYIGQSVAATNASSLNAYKWKWEVGGDEPMTSDVENPEFVFATLGEKTITLTAYAADGSSAAMTKTINVEALPVPVAGFSVPTDAAVGKRVSFLNTTVPAEGCKFEWTMPDAEEGTATTFNAATTFAEPGEYTVTLKATNAAGSHTCSQKVLVKDVAPEADFELLPSVLLKGGTVGLRDRSKHYPKQWYWTVKNDAHHFVFDKADNDLVLDNPGTYDVSLTATNDLGSGTASRKKALIVCNADGLTGLNFTGGSENVTFKTPITSNTGFTLDWWMYPRSNKDYSHAIGNETNGLLIRTQSDGALVFSLGGITYSTQAGLVSQSEWHHYAFVFDNGNVSIYKDGNRKEFFYTPWVGFMPAQPETFRLGGTEAPMNAIIDEFKVWNSALSGAELRRFANSPIEDVAKAEADHKLALYYQFNQSSGDVQDATSNANTGQRNGFGPEGDAWSESLGVFCLGEATRTDVTADYLTNYQAPFLKSGEVINPSDPERFVGLLTDSPESTWVLENIFVIGDIATSLYVDMDYDDALALSTKSYDFEASVSDHKAYQTVTLPAGHYVFGFEPVMEISDDASYVAVAAGAGLPASANMAKEAMGHAALTAYETEFSLYRPAEVSLGLVLNTMGEGTIAFKRFYLEKKITNDDFTWTTGIGSSPSLGGNGVDVRPVAGGLRLCSASPRRVRVCDVAGRVLFDRMVEGETTVPLSRGIYLVAGRKVLVK